MEDAITAVEAVRKAGKRAVAIRGTNMLVPRNMFDEMIGLTPDMSVC
jgi:hypothetical protein